MIIPVRCFSCGKLIGQHWETYKERLSKGEESKKILDSMGIERFCCRRLFISNVDMIKEVGRFNK